MNKFVKDRHDAFVSAVVDDEWSKVKRYAKKYGVPMPKDEKGDESRHIQGLPILHRYFRRCKRHSNAEMS